MKIQILILLLVRHIGNAERPFLKFGMFERIPGYFKEDNLGVVHDEFGNVGVMIYIMEWLSLQLNVTYQIVPMLGNDVGRPTIIINGSIIWTGPSMRFLNGEFDVMGPPVLLSLERFHYFDYVGIGSEERSALFVPALTEQSPILSTLRPFKLSVWALVLITLFSIAVCFTGTSVVLGNNRIQWKISLISDHIFNTLAILMNQGEVLRLRNRYRLPFRLTNAAWCLFAVVMVNLYSSTLTSYITVRKMNPPPSSGIQVINDGIFDFLLPRDGYGRELIMSAKSGPLKKMGDNFRRKPQNFVPDAKTCFEKVASGCCACTELVSSIEYRLSKDFKETGKCRVHIRKPNNGYSSVGLLVRKDSSYRNRINLGCLTMFQTGLVEYWSNQFVRPEAAACQEMNKKARKLRRLNLRDLASAFFILSIGYLVSLIAFLMEQFRRCSRVDRRSPNSSSIM